jgi:tetratricopeptide (TPR) repeat protein
MRRTSSLALALCLVFLPSSVALAEGDAKEADAHFLAGTKAFEESDYAKAVEELQKSVVIKPTAKAFLTLGNAYVKTGQLDDAKAAFERVLQIDPKSKKRVTVERLIKSLGVLASTKLKISSSPPGATVYVDLKAEGAKGKTPVDVGVTPGPHRIILELDGYERLNINNATAIEG